MTNSLILHHFRLISNYIFLKQSPRSPCYFTAHWRLALILILGLDHVGVAADSDGAIGTTEGNVNIKKRKPVGLH